MTSFVGLFALMAAGCGASTERAPHIDTPSAAKPSPIAYSAQSETREDVTALFLDPAEAGLSGGETQTVPEGTLSRLNICVPLNPLNTPGVPVDKQYATAKEAFTVPYKGRLTQQGWVLPSEAAASTLMKQVNRKLPQCRYSGSTNDPVDPTRRISGVSRPQTYEPDAFGWHGQQIEQLMNVNGERTSVSTVLILQRGPVILALDYTNYEPKEPEQTLRAYNLGVLRRVLAHPA
ncbi:hypothetical protein Psi02_00320 [Planotetraspora silvatica]|uniref:Uncharacterized protein n=1 Tax=Planotetraspora silvatica TaxID=234614 RepID=A0A8J3XP71_9ACTN|nr:hypothetical protein [Planotetraspora silvatica]GII43608.1 hypothetical protein Psi02_00320 [Planotetraspora silvatica]